MVRQQLTPTFSVYTDQSRDRLALQKFQSQTHGARSAETRCMHKLTEPLHVDEGGRRFHFYKDTHQGLGVWTYLLPSLVKQETQKKVIL